ncbi:MAG: hypothetical protein JWP87_6187 [Labilithrix sp.]|nr:hypothetical protein [Labilithrix sp.]
MVYNEGVKARLAFATAVGGAALGFVALVGLGACGSDDETRAPAAAEAGADRTAAAPRKVGDDVPDAAAVPDAAPDVDAAPFEAGACNERIDAVPVMDSPHVADGTQVAYSSNPPSSGPHYNSWANFQELTHPVDDGYLVHSMEHGAVLLLYRCETPDAACDALVASLRAVRDALPADPLCDPAIRVRIVIAPRAANDVSVAAAAWGHVYRADCVDPASLTAFIVDHYAKAPENFCVPGQVF